MRGRDHSGCGMKYGLEKCCVQAFIIVHVTGDDIVMKQVVQRNPFRLKGHLCILSRNLSRKKDLIQKKTSASIGSGMPPPRRWGRGELDWIISVLIEFQRRIQKQSRDLPTPTKFECRERLYQVVPTGRGRDSWYTKKTMESSWL